MSVLVPTTIMKEMAAHTARLDVPDNPITIENVRLRAADSIIVTVSSMQQMVMFVEGLETEALGAEFTIDIQYNGKWYAWHDGIGNQVNFTMPANAKRVFGPLQCPFKTNAIRINEVGGNVPAVSLYDEVAEDATADLQGVFVESDKSYAVLLEDGRIAKYDASHVKQWEDSFLDTDGYDFAGDGSGNYYGCDRDTGKVVKVNSLGGQEWAVTCGTSAVRVNWFSTGVYVAFSDGTGDHVRKLADADGATEWTFDVSGSAYGVAAIGTKAFIADGTTAYRINDADGSADIDESIFDYAIRDFCVTPDGDIVAVGGSDGVASEVTKFTTDLNVIWKTLGTIDFAYNQVSVNSLGEILAATLYDSPETAAKFTSEGDHEWTYEIGTSAKGIHFPSEDYVYLASDDNNLKILHSGPNFRLDFKEF